MKEKIVFFSLGAITVLLTLVVVNTMRMPFAWAQGPKETPSRMMAADNGTIYILKNDKLSVYYWDNPSTRPLLKQAGTLKYHSEIRVGERENKTKPSTESKPNPK